MANIKGTNLSSPIVPFTDLDKFPTHLSKYGKGGHKEVTTLQDLNSIPVSRLTVGTLCYVVNVGTEYRCTGFKKKSDPGTIITDDSLVNDTDYVAVWDKISGNIVVSDEVPSGGSNGSLWLDTGDNNEDLDTRNSEELGSVKRSLSNLQKQLDAVLKLLNFGVSAGDSTNSWRTKMKSVNKEINPLTGQAKDVILAPDGTDAASRATVPNISIKVDTSENFRKNYRNLLNGELIWVTDKNSLYIYIDGKFKPTILGSKSDELIPDTNNMTKEELRAAINDGSINFDSLGFVDLSGDEYKARVNEEGNLIVYSAKEQDITRSQFLGEYDNFISPYLHINSVFCGGANNETSYISCSHNFVELGNSGNTDINLNGLYLMYRPYGVSSWQWIPLVGKIKAGSTYLIRGARCSVDTNTTTIKVDTYDLEWYLDNSVDGKIRSNKLISFSQQGSTFYLVWGKKNKETGSIQIYDVSDTLIDISSFNLEAPYRPSVIKGYVDSVGIMNGSGEGGKSVTISNGHSMDDCLFFRWTSLDPARQANKAYGKRSSAGQWTYIDLKQTNFPEADKVKYTPKSGGQKKNIFTTKTVFNPNKPNYLNITFGRQATEDNVSAVKKKATRCFNWVSIGYYNEYLEYRLSGETNWKKIYSITEDSVKSGKEYYKDVNVEKFLRQYKRIRWISSNGTPVTSHKVILKGLSKGTYEYRVGRDGQPEYESETLTFKVLANSEVTSFSFIQTTDQQGFNWMEYEAWRKTCNFIQSTEQPTFTINTGDITQNGNRENEWLDYYLGRESMRGIEEMFTVGNNDLCGVDTRDLGDGSDKLNHLNVSYYYTFELDEYNPAIFEYSLKDTPGASQVYNTGNLTGNIDGVSKTGASGENYYGFTYFVPSLYSFDFGTYHFVSLNSEFTNKTYSIYSSYNEEEQGPKFKASMLSQLEDWFRKDLLLWKKEELNKSAEEISKDKVTSPSNCGKALVYMHEMPFTILTKAGYNGESFRTGSKLNDQDSKGNSYVFSRLFKAYGIRLVFGGHKHTYSLSRPMYDAPDEYITAANAVNTSVNLITGPMSATSSRRPVVQVLSSNWKTEYNTPNPHVRYERVSTISAPTYVMSQASGYKLVSNWEIPSSDIIVWLNKYFPAIAKEKEGSSVDVENVEQHYPTYIKYELSPTGIKVYSIQVSGIWEVDSVKNSARYIWNETSSGGSLGKKIIKPNNTSNDYLEINL